MSQLKSTLCQILLDQLNRKIAGTQQAITNTKESRDSNTKSSAGDKYETGRAMMQQELDKLELQLNQTLQLKQVLSDISIEKQYDRVEQGSLVFTNRGTYFMAFAHGKLKVGGKLYFVVSMISPVAQALRDKRVGDTIVFQGRKIVLEEIL